MAKKATTLHDNLGNDLLPVTNASITFMDSGNSVQAEINDLKEKTQYNKGHYTTVQELVTAYPNGIQNPQSRKGWYAIVGETDTVWIWDIEGNEWKDSGVSSGGVESVNGLDGEVILTGGNINATATINDTSKTELINKHLTDIYSELDNTVDLDSSQLITGTKVFTEVIGLANTSEGTVDQIKHINSNFLITSGTGQNLLNIDEGLETISAFNRELAYEDEIAEIQGNYATKDELSQEINNVTDIIPTVIDNVTTDNSSDALSAKQGKVLNERINQIVTDINNLSFKELSTDLINLWELEKGLYLLKYNRGRDARINYNTGSEYITVPADGTIIYIFDDETPSMAIAKHYMVIRCAGASTPNIYYGLSSSATNGNVKNYSLASYSDVYQVRQMIPTLLSQLTPDSTHRTVTDEQISKWDNTIALQSQNDIAIASSNTKYTTSNSSTELSNKTLFESTPTDTAVRMRGCVYGNGIYVVVGTSGAIERSTDAQDWELIDSFTSNVIVSVAYGGGYFICVDSAGGIFKSSDCITWRQLTSTITDIINAVIYVNGKFALVGSNGLIAFSNDGETFNLVSSGVTNELTSITRGLDKYVAVSTAGDILTSINGVDWINNAVDSTHYRTATFGKNIFVIGGQGGKIKYSADAINWVDATHDSTSSVNYIRDIKYANGKFYAVMYISTGQGEIWTSLDGATWTKTQNTAGRLWCLGYGNDILFASGDNGAIWILDLDINWLDTQPTINANQYIWSKEIYYLTDGSVLEGEVEVYPELTNLENKIPDTSGFVTTNTTQKITGAKSFSGTVGNTQTEAGIYLGLDENVGAENANMAIVSANTASYIDMGRPNVDYDFRIIKWNTNDNKHAQFVYGGNASGVITIPQASGVMALTSDLGTQATFSLSGTTLTITPK